MISGKAPTVNRRMLESPFADFDFGWVTPTSSIRLWARRETPWRGVSIPGFSITQLSRPMGVKVAGRVRENDWRPRPDFVPADRKVERSPFLGSARP